MAGAHSDREQCDTQECQRERERESESERERESGRASRMREQKHLSKGTRVRKFIDREQKGVVNRVLSLTCSLAIDIKADPQ